MLGFTSIVVVTNNCTDHSPELLDALAQTGWLHHIRHDIRPGGKITRAKLKVAAAHRSVRRADWVLVCDVDEFLVIHRGAGLIGDLIDLAVKEPDFLGMSINWKVFGTSGITRFEDAPVHRQFIYANPSKMLINRSVKSIFRNPRRFGAIGEHSPRLYDLAREGRPWGSPGLKWVNSAGVRVPRWSAGETYLSTLPPRLITHEVAQMNHYMLRSEDTFNLKRGSRSPVALGNRYRQSYFDAANEGDEVDASAFSYAERFDKMQAKIMALPDVARLHALCCADHVSAICEKAGQNPEDDPRYRDFLARAAAYS